MGGADGTVPTVSEAVIRAALTRAIPMNGSDRAQCLAPKVARDGWINGAAPMRSARGRLWTSFQTEILN